MPRKHSVDPLLLDSPLAPPARRRRSRTADPAGTAGDPSGAGADATSSADDLALPARLPKGLTP
ncbi:MAG: hypothetical protein ACKOFO_02255, partial [Gemmatimonadota bacterium]